MWYGGEAVERGMYGLLWLPLNNEAGPGRATGWCSCETLSTVAYTGAVGDAVSADDDDKRRGGI